MDKDEKNEQEEQFSNDPGENLKAENEILKLKMQAEYGALFGSVDEGLSPEMENQFLQNVLAFEQQWQNRKTTTIYKLLDEPAFQPAVALNEEEVRAETARLLHLLKERNIELHIRGKYKAGVIYRFITEEFFQHETDDMLQAGMTRCFTYEEFHPNHRLDIEETTIEFLKNWFEHRFDEYTMILAEQLFLLTDPAKPPVFISKKEVLERMKKIFDCYRKFDDCKLALMDIDVQWDDEHQRGMGYSEGGVRYNAVLENGDVEKIEGPFKLYFSCEFGLWQVMHFVFPQFKWPNEQ